MAPKTRRKARKMAKDKAQFDFKGFHKLETKGKLKYGDLNELYVARVDTKNVGYTDLLNFVRSKQEDIKQFYPNAYMNIAIKYRSQSTPISAGFFSLDSDVALKAPYDHDETDEIDHFFIQYMR